MRWEDERYVKFYTRDTSDWLALSWQAQGLFGLIMRKVDRAGVLELGKRGLPGFASHVGGPSAWAEMEPFLQELIDDGCVEVRGNAIVVPNFIEAQETPSSDKERKRAQRERARDEARRNGDDVSPRKAAGDVTPGHAESRDVTDGHAESRGVTPRQDKPIQDKEEILESEPVGSSPSRQVWDAYLAERRYWAGAGPEPQWTDKRAKLVKARLREHGLEVVMAAAVGIWRSKWHRDEGRTSFDLAMRDAGHVEDFASKVSGHTQLPLGPPVEDEALAAEMARLAAGEKREGARY